ncbi:hypothetical protein Poli38472_003394 [Pythium oligandrum]|uniref:PLD phosphodiesterase domain-containing protein n=1 Tax=Pythium oligandrum TaxID=41045 RepID=A0A8K1C6Q6_PYTOL|nr:hypothetical protein Poli38472_003394 [Pythium oligandrum]|eukprot:TMW57469.1 hypothetical protein Poli38472_003394 [Pythium oligandrum]
MRSDRSPRRVMPMEATPLRRNVSDYQSVVLDVTPVRDEPLPRWFLIAAVSSVVVTLVWMISLVVLQHSPHFHASDVLGSETVAAQLYLYAGVLNSLLGSFLSASGYCCQKWAHNRIKANPALGTASQQPLFVFGLFLLAVGTISAVLNLGILGQAVQAPFAALTLIYSALLGRFVLREKFVLTDLLSSVLIVTGVAVDVFAARLAQVPQQSYTLESLGALIFRKSVFPIGYTVLALSYITLLLRQVQHHNLHSRAIGLLAFSSCAGIMAGFTSLATKSAVEVVKAALCDHHLYDIVNPFFILIVAGIPCALVPQLFFLNKGLEYFGTLKFIPLYQAFIILGNLVCGMIFYNEMASYATTALLCFLGGVAITLSGVCLLLVKVDTHTTVELPLTYTAGSDPMTTEFDFDEMEFARNDVKTLRDFEECKRSLRSLLNSATSSIYYSTFLCDFKQALSDEGEASEETFLSCLHAAVARGVQVFILYNPVVDYGTESVAELEMQLPRGVQLTCSVSDLGPSFLTQCLSNNSKYAFHHQKYLCVDENVIMVTGCDVNSEREGWLRANALGYYWHELSVVAPCTPKMFQWIRANHSASEKKHHYDQFHDSPPFPLVAGGWREENAMVNMILRAQHSVHLENQILISGGSMQHNRICAAIVRRVAEAHRKQEPFSVLILTNAAQQDEPSQVTRLYCTISIQWSLEQLESAAQEHGLSKKALWEHVVVGRLESHGVLIKVHSNILITDGRYALRSSSNLADRSLSARPTDTELGLLFKGKAVAKFQQELFNMYMSTDGVEYSMESVLAAARRHSPTASSDCCIIPLTKKRWSPVVSWFLMNLFIYASEGATGGRVKVTYRKTTTTIDNASASIAMPAYA